MSTFRLGRLLRLRTQHEQAVARDLAVAQRAADEEHTAHAQLRAARLASMASAARTASGGTTIGSLVSISHALEALDAHAEIAQARTREANVRVESCHQALVTAARARMMLDRLRQRHDEHVRVDVSARERATMDAIALARHGRADRSASTASTRSST